MKALCLVLDTFETWTPIARWIPEHSMHIMTARLMLAHSGSFAPQSTHSGFACDAQEPNNLDTSEERSREISTRVLSRKTHPLPVSRAEVAYSYSHCARTYGIALYLQNWKIVYVFDKCESKWVPVNNFMHPKTGVRHPTRRCLKRVL